MTVDIPSEMQEALPKSRADFVELFWASCDALREIGLEVYPTNSPNTRMRHPANNVVFCTLWFQVRKGPRFEIRVDACPASFNSETSTDPIALKQYDSGSRARWAVYPVRSQNDIEAVIRPADYVI